MGRIQWQTIADDLRGQIERGELEVGAKVASETDIALRYGVSRPTAHRALSELQRMGLVVRQRRWGTVVAPTVPQPVPVRSGQVALVVDRFVQRYNFPQADLTQGLQDGLGEDFHVIVTECKSDWEREARQLRKFQSAVDGIALYPTSDARNTPLIQRMHDSGYPIVVLDRFPEGLRVDSVVSDNEGATLKAIRALEARGHRRIGFFSFHKPDFSSVLERHAAYGRALHEVGIEDPTSYTRWFHRDLENQPQMFVQSVSDALVALLHRDDPVTAIFCVEDLVAAAVLQACDQLGVSVPDQVELATFNDWPPMMLRSPWATHRIVQRTYDIGKTAAQLILDRMHGHQGEPRLARVSADFFVADAGIIPASSGPMTTHSYTTNGGT